MPVPSALVILWFSILRRGIFNVCCADEPSEGERSTLVTSRPASLEAIGRRPLLSSARRKWKKGRGSSPVRPVLVDWQGLRLTSQEKTARMKRMEPWDWDDGNDGCRRPSAGEEVRQV